MVYLRQLNWDELHPQKPKQKEKSKMNENTVVENAVETEVDVEEVAAPVVEEVVVSSESQTPVDSATDEPSNPLIEEKAEAVAKVAQAKLVLAEATQNLKEAKAHLKSIKSACKDTGVKREKKQGFFGKKAVDVILSTLKEMDGPVSTKDIVSRLLDTNRYDGSRSGLNATACITLNSLADVGTVKKEGNRRAAKFQIV